MGIKIGGVFEPFSWLKQSVQWRASWRQLQPLPSSDPISFKHANGKLHFSIYTLYPDEKEYSNIFVLTFLIFMCVSLQVLVYSYSVFPN